MAMTFRGYIALFSIFLGLAQGQIDGAWKDDGQGKEYYVSTTPDESEKTWQQARDLCRANYGDLASIHSEQERAFIAQVSSDAAFGGPIWNGLNDLDWDDTWTWSDNSGGDLQNLWADQQPDPESFGAQCVWQWANGTGGALPDGLWHDGHCGTIRGFVCKRTVGASTPLTTTPTTPVGGFCPNGYYGGAGNKCFKPHYHTMENGKTWEEALFECRNGPGLFPNLASIQTEQEQAIVTSFMQRLPVGMWVGLARRDDLNPWLWIDNSQFSYTNWAPGEPTAGLNEHCGEMWILYPGMWNNIACTNRRGFVCQTFKDPTAVVPTRNPTIFPCPSGFISYYYACYRVMNTGKTYQEAQTDCENMGATLTSSLDTAENAALQVMASQIASAIWTGLNDDDNDNSYKWSDGFLVKYTNWFELEPSKETGGGCVSLGVDGFWRDDVCSSIYSYVCKSTSVTPPSTPVHVEGSCPNDLWVEYGSDCYFFQKNSARTKTWPEADRECFEMYERASLASIHNERENIFIYDNMKGTDQAIHAWIGMFRSTQDDQFRWADLSPVQFENWAEGEPNGNAADTGGCVRMYTAQGIDGGVWDDYFCDERAYNVYVCKGPKMTMVTTPAQGPGSCPDTWTPLGDSCYLFQPDEFSTWSQAQDDCASMYSSNIASVHYKAEDEWIRDQMTAASTLPEVRNYWIGYIKDSGVENADFYWFDGTVKNYENWGPGEPNDDTGTENCGEVTITGAWNDHGCEFTRGYVCKMDKCRDGACFSQSASSDGGGGLSGGEVAGVVFGVLFGVLALGLVAVLALGFFGVISVGPCANRDRSDNMRFA